MFNPEAMPPQTGKVDPRQERTTSIADHLSTAEVPAEESESLATFAKKPENMLSPGMSPDEIEDLSGKFVEKTGEIHEENMQAIFREQLAEQRAMLQEEILRNSIVGNEDSNNGESERIFSQDSVVSSNPGTFEWIASKLEHIPGGKKLLGALTLVAGLSVMPREAIAGDSWLEGLVKTSISQTVRDYQNQVRNQQRAQEQAARKAEAEARRYQQEMERMKDQYARESQRIVDQYDREDSSIERSYASKLLSQENRRGDAIQKEKARHILDVSYHKEKLKAAEKAWNGMSRVKEKYIQISTTGVSYMSNVNENFLKNLQRVATKEVQELAKFGETGIVTIIPLLEMSAGQEPTQKELPSQQKQSIEAEPSGATEKIEINDNWNPGYGADTWGKTDIGK